MAGPNKLHNDFPEQEIQFRFLNLVKAVLNTRPKPLKSMGPKRTPSQSKKRRRRSTLAA